MEISIGPLAHRTSRYVTFSYGAMKARVYELEEEELKAAIHNEITLIPCDMLDMLQLQEYVAREGGHLMVVIFEV